MKERFQNLLAEYGAIAIGIHFALFFTSVFLFWLALGMGMELGSESIEVPNWLKESGSVRIIGAYVASQVIKPLRLGLTLVLTPIVAKVIRRDPSTSPEDDSRAEDLSSVSAVTKERT